jgi:Mn2+/Fe2+ NRAMP family transporter
MLVGSNQFPVRLNANVATPGTVAERVRRFLGLLGPGLITGAAYDEPSGIATYSQVGARFGFTMLWTMPLSYPLMSAIQEICAWIGRVTGTPLENSGEPLVGEKDLAGE